MAYFENSQKIKAEIEREYQMLEKLKEHLSGKDVLSCISIGSGSSVYSLGKTQTGIWVALREHDLVRRGYSDNDDALLPAGFPLYNSYCHEAERFFNKGKRVPLFCVCGIYRDIPFLLVEDLSDGESWEIGHNFAEKEYAFRTKGKKQEEVWFDFDSLSVTQNALSAYLFNAQEDELYYNKLKHFKPEARINL